MLGTLPRLRKRIQVNRKIPDSIKSAQSNNPHSIYQRSKHERVYCSQCETHSDGFRDEQELRRHQDREHKSTVKKWICREPTGGNHPKPELPLSRCKACSVQKKTYGAYYNAAAHLRRAHFKSKTRRSDRSKVDDPDKRGGKGGGDWPPMSELKHFMEEIEVPNDYSITQEDEWEETKISDTMETIERHGEGSGSWTFPPLAYHGLPIPPGMGNGKSAQSAFQIDAMAEVEGDTLALGVTQKVGDPLDIVMGIAEQSWYGESYEIAH